MVNTMMIEALKTKASDIHFEAMEKTSRLRYRIDGALIERPAPPKALHNAIVSRIKIMSDLDIAERRVPQDGRFKVKAMGKEVDIRVSILPTIHGEKVVMRILDKANLAPGLASLGLDDYAYKAMKFAIEQPHGIILVTGPTGSGKTTTLYSCLQDLNQPNVNIVTAEDPVEYQLPGVNQVAVNQQVGLTFAGVLRSVLRQDPDIVLVGEIRDGETADIAVKAALTGHLVLSTLHTNDAVRRGGASLRHADRRRSCSRARSSSRRRSASSASSAPSARRRWRGRSTRRCSRPTRSTRTPSTAPPSTTRWAARSATAAATRGAAPSWRCCPISPKIRGVIEKGGDADAEGKIALEEGMVTLKEAGMRKVRAGVTSLEAAFEVTGGE